MGEGTFVGGEDFFFFFFEFFGEEAFGVGGGLFTDVVGGGEVEVGFGDFDEVAEGVIEFDFEVFDFGFFLFCAFEVGEPGFVIGGEIVKVVEGVIVAWADDAPGVDFRREFVVEGGVEEGAEVVAGVDAVGEGFGGGGFHFGEELEDGGELIEGIADGAEFAGVMDAVLEAAEDAGDVADFFEGVLEGEGVVGVFEEVGDALLAAVKFLGIEEWGGEVLFEEAGTGGSGGGVHGFDEGAGAGILGGFKDFEVTECGGVEEEGFFGGVFFDGAEIFWGFAEGFGGVGDEGAGGAEGGVFAADAEAVEGDDAEGIEDELSAVKGVELEVWEFREGAILDKVLEVGPPLGEVWVRFPGGEGDFWDEDFFGVEAVEDGEEVEGVGVCGDAEAAGGEFEPGDVGMFF